MNKTLTKFLAAGLIALAAVVPARSENLADMQAQVLGAAYMAEYKVAKTEEAIKLEYVGSSTEALVSIERDRVIAYAPAGTADTAFGASGIYLTTTSAYDTMGELCDAIDALASYKCSLLGAKRDDNPKFLNDQAHVTGTNDLKAAGGFRVLWDTGGTYDTSDTNVYLPRIGITPLVGRRVLLKQCLFNGVAADDFEVWGKLRKFEGDADGVTRDDTTQVWKQAAAANTTLTVNFDATNSGGGILFAKDAHVVVGLDDDAATAQGVTNAVQCRWEER